MPHWLPAYLDPPPQTTTTTTHLPVSVPTCLPPLPPSGALIRKGWERQRTMAPLWWWSLGCFKASPPSSFLLLFHPSVSLWLVPLSSLRHGKTHENWSLLYLCEWSEDRGWRFGGVKGGSWALCLASDTPLFLYSSSSTLPSFLPPLPPPIPGETA